MLDSRFIAELDRTDSTNGEKQMIYIYGTGDRPDGYLFAAGFYTPEPDVPVDGAYALFKSAEDAIAFSAGWYAMNPDGALCLTPIVADRARAIYAAQ